MNHCKFTLSKQAGKLWRGIAARRRSTTITLAVVTFLAVVVISCRTVTRVAVKLPDVPGYAYAGSKACEECHPTIYQSFQLTEHALLTMGGPNVQNAGCESCHGPSAKHAEDGGETKPAYTFAVGRPMDNSFGANPAMPGPRAVEKVCYECHADVRGQFNLASHHPVPEGKMSCTVCHPPHRNISAIGSMTMARSRAALTAQDDNCLACHPAQRGPYVFEHEAMHEGCTTCHRSHGSVNDKMLVARDSNLCLKCHFQQAVGGQIRIGGADHTVRIQQGTCWTAGCHEAVHGSRVNSSLRY